MSHKHDTDQTAQIITVAAVAALVGAATAMFLTPRTGEQVRGGIKRRAHHAANSAKSRLHGDEDTDLEDIIEAVRERLQNAADDAAEQAKTTTAAAKTTVKRASRSAAAKTPTSTTRK